MSSLPPGGRVAVTGATGFVGRIVVRTLTRAGYEVVGIDRTGTPPEIGNLLTDHLEADLTLGWPETGPLDGVVHLAALAAVGPSFAAPQRYINHNSAMITHMCERLLESQSPARVLIISSGAVYGAHDSSGPIVEDTAVDFTSPYVVSKVLVENQTAYYRRRGLDALIARPFNHIGVGQGPGFIVPDLVAKVRRWDGRAPMPVGNLASARDYTDVHDVALAYLALLNLASPKHAVYNVASGRSYTGHEVLKAICAELGVAVPPTETRETRAVDPSAIVGSAARLAAETDWVPTAQLDESIRDFIGREANSQS